MGRPRNSNRDLAFKVYSDNKGKITPKEISEELNISANSIRNWKSVDEWDIKLGYKKKVGAPKGNKNGTNGGAPKENLNGFKHGKYIDKDRLKSKKFLAKYLPKVTEAIMDDLQENKFSALDMLWTSIDLQFAAILRSQEIMHVANKEDLTKVLKKTTKGKVNSKEYELQFAWDKQQRFMESQGKAIAALNKVIASYEDLLHRNWDMTTEEQRTRIDVLKAKLNGNDNEPIKIEFVKASEQNERS